MDTLYNLEADLARYDDDAYWYGKYLENLKD